METCGDVVIHDDGGCDGGDYLGGGALMSDIVERLRGRARGYRLGGPKQMAVMLDEGADEIERLRAALREIDQQRYTERRTISTDNAYEIAMALNDTLLAVMKVARAALEGK